MHFLNRAAMRERHFWDCLRDGLGMDADKFFIKVTYISLIRLMRFDPSYFSRLRFNGRSMSWLFWIHISMHLIGMQQESLGQGAASEIEVIREPLAEQLEGDATDSESLSDPFGIDWSRLDEDELIDLLKQGLHGRRQLATLETWKRRSTLREIVQRLSQDDDLEVRTRASWILGQWARGALPETPEEVGRWLSQSSTAVAMDTLLAEGYFSSVVVALEESKGREDARSMRDRIASLMVKGFPVYAVRAYESGLISEFLEVLDLVSNTVELAVCRYQLMKEAEVEITNENLLPSSASDWTPLLRLQAECILEYLRGDLNKAAELAKQSIDPEQLIRLRMVSEDWETLADELVSRARNAPKGSLERTRLWTFVLVSAERSLDSLESAGSAKTLRQEAVENLLMETTEETVEGKLAAAMRWKALASHGEVDDALSILAELAPGDAASLCKDASRVGQAFSVLGRPLDEIDLSLSNWIDEAIQKQAATNARELSTSVRELMTLMQCLIRIGRDDLAFEIAFELSHSGVKVGSLDLREFVLSTLSLTKRIDWMVALAVPKDGKSISRETYNIIARGLPDCDLSTLETAVEALVAAFPQEPIKSHLEQTVSLFLSDDSDASDQSGIKPNLFAKLFTFLVSESTSVRVPPGVRVNVRKDRLNLNFVKLFSKHGELRYSRILLQELVRKGDVEAMLVMAEQQLGSGQSKAAELLFESVLRNVVQGTKKLERFSNGLDSNLYIRAQLGLWRVARLRQEDEFEQRNLKGIRYALCTPDLNGRNQIAEYLSELSELDLSLEVFESLLPVVALGQRGRVGLYDVARRYAPLVKEDRPGEAARWFDLALNQTMWTVDFRANAYVTLPMFVHRWALEDEIGQGDVARVNLRLDRMLQLDAMDIDFAERLLPMMRQAGMEKDADRVLNLIVDKGIAYGQRFPFDAMTCNNVAWVAAVNERRLDDALTLSKLAVRAEPDSAIYRDTLAEVLFQLDRPIESLQIGKGCLLDDPTQWHLHEQFQKYRSSLSSSESN